MTRLKNQRPLTQTADAGGVNGMAGSGKDDGIETLDPFNWEVCL